MLIYIRHEIIPTTLLVANYKLSTISTRKTNYYNFWLLSCIWITILCSAPSIQYKFRSSENQWSLWLFSNALWVGQQYWDMIRHLHWGKSLMKKNNPKLLVIKKRKNKDLRCWAQSHNVLSWFKNKMFYGTIVHAKKTRLVVHSWFIFHHVHSLHTIPVVNEAYRKMFQASVIISTPYLTHMFLRRNQ